MSELLRITVLVSLLVMATAINPMSHIVVPRQTVVTDLPGAWSFFGCFQDNPSQRSLNGASFVNTTAMTIEACVNFCNSNSFIYAGLEFGQECYCDVIFENAEISAPDTDCSEACVGNPAQLCGAPNRLSVYSSGTAAIFPAEVPSVGAWNGLGCFNDSVSARILQERIDVPNLTVETCTTACFGNGFTFAGVEFGQECWCGTQILNGGTFVGNANGISGNPPVRTTTGGPFCNLPCTGDPTELCGGSDRMNLYTFTGSTAPSILPSLNDFLLLGCFADLNQFNPILIEQITLTSVTVDSCTSACQGNGLSISGVRAGTECFCDRQAPTTTPLDDSACNIPCTANNFEICGGSAATLVYQFQNVSPVLKAFALLPPQADALTSLINSVTTANVGTVGPQIVSGIQALTTFIGTNVAGAADAAVGGGSNPLTGDFATEVGNALGTDGAAIDRVFHALGAQSAILKPGFATPILSGIQSLMNAAVGLARDCAFNIIPSLSSESLSFQTDFENTSAQAASAY